MTSTLVNKERAKIENDLGINVTAAAVEIGMDSEMEAYRKARKQLIPRLLETVYHCVVTEELWAELKRVKVHVVDFDRLRKFVIAETKKYMTDLL